MKLTGKVLKRFTDSLDGKTYAPKGTIDLLDEYTQETMTYPSTYIAERDRYEQLEKLGYVEHGSAIENKKYKMEDKKEEE